MMHFYDFFMSDVQIYDSIYNSITCKHSFPFKPGLNDRKKEKSYCGYF